MEKHIKVLVLQHLYAFPYTPIIQTKKVYLKNLK